MISAQKWHSTRRVAVYVGTHCNIGSKRAFSTGVLDRWHNCLLIYWHNVAQRATKPTSTSVCLLLRHDSAKRWRQQSPKFFLCVIAPQPYVPHQNSPTKGTSLGCRLVPEMMPISQTPPRKYSFLIVLGTCKTPAQKFANLSTVYACAHRFTSFISKMLKIGTE